MTITRIRMYICNSSIFLHQYKMVFHSIGSQRKLIHIQYMYVHLYVLYQQANHLRLCVVGWNVEYSTLQTTKTHSLPIYRGIWKCVHWEGMEATTLADMYGIYIQFHHRHAHNRHHIHSHKWSSNRIMQYSPLQIICSYLRLCIMHHTLPNRDVYSIYQTDRDDQGTMCRGHICHSFGHKVHAFTHADITPSGAFLPGLSVSWDGLLPNREPTCLQGNAHGSWGHACDDSSQADTALISA